MPKEVVAAIVVTSVLVPPVGIVIGAVAGIGWIVRKIKEWYKKEKEIEKEERIEA